MTARLGLVQLAAHWIAAPVLAAAGFAPGLRHSHPPKKQGSSAALTFLLKAHSQYS
jgi:hypothetical protein